MNVLFLFLSGIMNKGYDRIGAKVKKLVWAPLLLEYQSQYRMKSMNGSTVPDRPLEWEHTSQHKTQSSAPIPADSATTSSPARSAYTPAAKNPRGYRSH